MVVVPVDTAAAAGAAEVVAAGEVVCAATSRGPSCPRVPTTAAPNVAGRSRGTSS